MGFSALLGIADRVLQDGVLSDEATYTPSAGDPVDVPCIFDAAYEHVDASNPGVTEQGPAVSFLIADLPETPTTDGGFTVTYSGTTYVPWDVRLDGMGRVVIHLHEQ